MLISDALEISDLMLLVKINDFECQAERQK
jgi:hypothetical protein